MATPPSPSSSFGGVGQQGMELFESNTLVTASHPGWPGQNVYIANQGSEPVPVTFGSGAISISATFPATQSVEIIGVSPISGYLPVTGNFGVTLPATQSVSVVNWPITQSVSITGTVELSGNFGTTQPTTDQTGSFAFHVTSSRLIMSPSTRIGFKVYNDSNSSYILAFGLTASLNKIAVVVPPQWTYEDPYPGWQGPVAGIGVATGSGTIYYTELRP